MVGFLAARRTSAGGRLPEVTVGCFVEAKHEKPRQSVGQLWSDLAGRFGSPCAGRARDLTAEELTVNLSHQIPDVHGRQRSTLRCHTRP